MTLLFFFQQLWSLPQLSLRTTAMTAAVSFPVLFILTLELLKCHGNKTAIVFGTLETRSTSQLTKEGFDLALSVSKNNSKFNSFFEKYNISLFSLETFVSVISF